MHNINLISWYICNLYSTSKWKIFQLLKISERFLQFTNYCIFCLQIVLCKNWQGHGEFWSEPTLFFCPVLKQTLCQDTNIFDGNIKDVNILSWHALKTQTWERKLFCEKPDHEIVNKCCKILFVSCAFQLCVLHQCAANW